MGDILYAIIIKPLELIFELIFAVSYEAVPNPAVNLIIMSLAINILVLPLYRRADVIQMETRKREEEISPVTGYIKRVFKGDERVMMLQAFYKIAGYNPLSSLKSIISLLLQIPFFIAAYQFLSHLPMLKGQSMGSIKDLAQPDGLITLGGLTVNLLPIFMTVINIASSVVYTKGQPLKDKIVPFLSAAIFLVLLYNSPSGLVFYWTFNNVFSLVKNLVYKTIDPKGDKKEKKTVAIDKKDKTVFWISMVYMSLLAGLLAPSSVIGSAPEDFIHVLEMNNPLDYIFNTLCTASGFFVIWIGVYFFLSSGIWKKIIAYAAFVIAICATFNFFVFSADMGFVSPELVFTDVAVSYETEVLITTTLAITVIGGAFLFLRWKFPTFMSVLLVAGALVVTVMGCMHIISIANVYKIYGGTDADRKEMRLDLSRTHENVVVLMMDRAISGYIPYIMEEDPELLEKFDGFTYYPNTTAFGGHTNISAPALFGGYDYTPEKMCEREDMPLRDKHNESLLLMPTLFTGEGYHATVVDMPYVDYSSIPLTSIFDDKEDIDAYISNYLTADSTSKIDEQLDITRMRNFIMYSFLRISPPVLHTYIYNGGNYHSLKTQRINTDRGYFHFPLSHQSEKTSSGVDPTFLTSYEILDKMTEVTHYEADKGQLILFCNETTHSPMQLQMPSFTLHDDVDNSSFFNESMGDIRMDKYMQIAHYQVNTAALRELGEWFDQLRENGVWDNTRIIIVSDHGFALDQFDDLIYEDLMLDAQETNSLLMVKDFNSTGFTTSDDFMTIADVPSIAMSDIIGDPVNPYTGNAISTLPKEQPQKVFLPQEWRIQDNNGYRFGTGAWYSVHDNIFERSNWEYLGEY